jgi:hypothetical protein
MSIVLYLVSMALATLSFVTVNGILKAIAALIVPVDPYDATGTAYRAALVERGGLMIYAIIWLASVIFIYAYYTQARTRRALFIRFGKVTVVELAVIGLGYGLPFLLTILR